MVRHALALDQAQSYLVRSWVDVQCQAVVVVLYPVRLCTMNRNVVAASFNNVMMIFAACGVVGCSNICFQHVAWALSAQAAHGNHWHLDTFYMSVSVVSNPT